MLETNFRITFSALLLAVAFIYSPRLYAYDIDDTAPRRKRTNKTVVRQRAHAPRTLTHSATMKIAELETPPKDVLLIRCTLTKFTVCRGLEISLYDQHGNLVATSNTGTEGVVGFEGLEPSGEYKAKIESPRYLGEVHTGVGRTIAIDAGPGLFE